MAVAISGGVRRRIKPRGANSSVCNQHCTRTSLPSANVNSGFAVSWATPHDAWSADRREVDAPLRRDQRFVAVGVVRLRGCVAAEPQGGSVAAGGTSVVGVLRRIFERWASALPTQQIGRALRCALRFVAVVAAFHWPCIFDHALPFARCGGGVFQQIMMGRANDRVGLSATIASTRRMFRR